MIDDKISSSLKKKMKVIDIGNGQCAIAITYLIGQLGRSVESDRGFGIILLNDAIDRIRSISRSVGCNLICVDCSDNPKILRYYESNGFFFVKKKNSSKLNTFVRYIKRKEIQSKKVGA